MDLIQALSVIQRYAAQDLLTSITIHQHASGQMIVTAYSPDLDIIAKDTGAEIKGYVNAEAFVEGYIDAGTVLIKEVQ